MSTLTTVAVIGAGQMGSGIAQVFAQAGLQVIVVDPTEAALERAQTGIGKSLNKLESKGKLSETAAAIAERLQYATAVSAVAPAQFVVEAAPEDLQLKTNLFAELDSVVGPEVVLASNTSSIAIASLAAATQRPSQVIGMHFMNPVPLMPCVEVIRSDITSETSFTVVADLITRLGKTMVVSKDRAGFIVNRILMPMINEAAHAVREEIATIEDIDTAMRLSCNFPMGPLTLADFIGIDTVVAILGVMHEGLGDDRFLPDPVLTDMVAAGKLGRKSGQGFYDYTKG